MIRDKKTLTSPLAPQLALGSSSNLQPVRLYRMSTAEHECPWGLKAAKLLKEKGITFEDHKLTSRKATEVFKQKYSVSTTPQIFFGDERIGGYTDLAKRFEVEAESADYSYTPVAALFSTAGLVAWSASIGISGFMGISLAMLASLKLMDLDAFSKSFEKYDLITQSAKPYAKVFPFLELLVGLGFLSSAAPIATGIGSLTLGVSGAVSVIKAVYIDKLELNCACVGGNSKAPLGVVSFLENAIMIGMGAFLLFSASSSRGDRLVRSSAMNTSPTVEIVQYEKTNNKSEIVNEAANMNLHN